MTEALFYPLFVLFALLFVRMLEQPTARRQLTALVALVLLAGVRTQAVVLIAALLLAVVLEGLLARRLRATLLAFAPIFTLLAAAAVVVVLIVAAGGQIPGWNYSELASSSYKPIHLVRSGAWNLAVYEIALGVVPLAALPLALARMLRGAASQGERALGLATLTLGLSVLVSVAALSSSPFGLGILHERNLFFLAPLVLACFARWLAGGLERPTALTLSSAAAAIALPLWLSGSVIARTNNVDSPTASWLTGFERLAPSVSLRGWIVVLSAVAVVCLLLVSRPVLLLLAPLIVFAWVWSVSAYSAGLTHADDEALAWVDRALPVGESAAIVNVGFPTSGRHAQRCSSDASYAQQGLVVWTEFFNKSVDHVYALHKPAARDGFPETPLAIGPGGLAVAAGGAISPRYVVIDPRQPIVGQRIATFKMSSLGPRLADGSALTLWRVDPPLRFVPFKGFFPAHADGHGC
jgi:hypothetical protein